MNAVASRCLALLRRAFSVAGNPVFLSVLFALSCLPACRPGVSDGVGTDGADTIRLSRATLLEMVRRDSFITVNVRDAWHPGRLLHRYVLVPRDSVLPARLPEGTLVRTPLRRAVVFSSVHAALLRELDCLDRVGGLCDVAYIVQPDVRRAVAEGRVADVGSSMRPDAERIGAVGADALLVSPFENAGYGPLESLGIPLVECADYMETSALGRAEWMRFFGLLFGCEVKADALYGQVERDYEALCSLAARAVRRPSLLCDMKEGAAWYVPAGGSTLGRLYADAGADYLFADRSGSGSVPLSFETVFSRAAEADIWLVKYGRPDDLTYAAMAADYAPFRRFRPWRERRIYGCNTFWTAFYEEVPFHPERLLRDAVRIFHPELLPADELRYFRPLAER